jgi:hypothetical protein
MVNKSFVFFSFYFPGCWKSGRLNVRIARYFQRTVGREGANDGAGFEPEVGA